MAETVLETVELTRSYGRGVNRFEALKGISLTVRAGESLAIVGKSGSGKSTLMHLLALLDQPTTGTVLLNGENASTIRGRRLNQARNQSFGFVFQQFFLVPHTTVLDNVIAPLKIAGVSSRARTKRGMELLESLGIADKAKANATDLSGGQKQRVVIARALANGPAVIFADEPTGNLDTATGAAVEAILFNLKRDHGITLVLVTHDPDLANKCDRSLFVRDGQLIESEHQS